MKISIIPLFIILIGKISIAATWKAEVKDAETSEVRTYSFDEIKSHKIELPKFQREGCVLKVNPPEKVASEGQTFNEQLVELQCTHTGGAVFIRKACAMNPTPIEKSVLTAVTVIEDAGKSAKSRKGKASVYLITLKCE